MWEEDIEKPFKHEKHIQYIRHFLQFLLCWNSEQKQMLLSDQRRDKCFYVAGPEIYFNSTDMVVKRSSHGGWRKSEHHLRPNRLPSQQTMMRRPCWRSNANWFIIVMFIDCYILKDSQASTCCGKTGPAHRVPWQNMFIK